MKYSKFLIILMFFHLNSYAQMPVGLDTVIEGRIKRILAKKDPHGGYQTDRLEYFDLKVKADQILEEFDFLNAIIADSYYGGEKSNEPKKNDLLEPSSKSGVDLKSIFINDQYLSNSLFNNCLDKADSILTSFYNKKVKNKNKDKEITGDDDDNLLVEVEVRVVESFSGKKELAGFEVLCKNPFIKNYNEDFGITTSARRKISPGYRLFSIRKGNVYQSKAFRVVFGDPNTYLIVFSNAKSERK